MSEPSDKKPTPENLRFLLEKYPHVSEARRENAVRELHGVEDKGKNRQKKWAEIVARFAPRKDKSAKSGGGKSDTDTADNKS